MTMSPWLADLRARVGHDLLLLPSVSVLVEDDDGRLLLVRQSATGRWGAVGGMVEPEEHPEVAAVREVREEAGVDVELTGLVAVVGGRGYTVRYPHGDVVSYVSSVYRARVVGGDVAPDDLETDAAAWFSLDELAGLPLGTFAETLFAELELVPAD